VLEAVLEADLHALTALARETCDRPALADGDAERLLAVDVESGIEGAGDVVSVQPVRRRDDDCVDRSGAAHLGEVGESFGVRRAAGGLLERVRDDVTDRGQLVAVDVGGVQEVGDAHPGDAGHADADASPFPHGHNASNRGCRPVWCARRH
jgi:hypothetical protein